MQQEGVSIINRMGGTVTGDSANALPIKLVSSHTGIKYFVLGMIATFIFILSLFALSMTQVNLVEVTGQSESFKEIIIK
jgi:hypothetical protein